MCDVPGLIEGASDGVGLGHKFLRHIQRTRILLHVVSGESCDVEEIVSRYKLIRNELKQYDEVDGGER